MKKDFCDPRDIQLEVNTKTVEDIAPMGTSTDKMFISYEVHGAILVPVPNRVPSPTIITIKKNVLKGRLFDTKTLNQDHCLKVIVGILLYFLGFFLSLGNLGSPVIPALLKFSRT